VRCAVDDAGSARQMFALASAFNQNIGSWNTAAVKELGVRALVPSHACGAPHKSFLQQWSMCVCVCVCVCVCQLGATPLVRRSTTRCIVVYCNAMYGAAVWRGTAGALGFVRCGVDGVGSARQTFYNAPAFNQNIGSWNTASVTTMQGVRALVPSHACGARPKSLSQQWSRRRCGRVPAQMWASPGADVGEAWLNCERALCTTV
jgi:surface protein